MAGEVKTAFSTLACPDWSWHELLQKGPAFGFDGVEVRLLERETDLLQVPQFQPTRRAASRRELDEAGFEVRGLASNVRFDSPDSAERTRQIQTGREHLALARELGASFVRVFGDTVPADAARRQAAVEQVAEGLERLGEAAEPLRLQVLIETHGDFADSQLMHATMSRVNSPAVGVLWDTHHPWRYYGEDLAETAQRLAAWVRHTHWKDSISRPRRPTSESDRQAVDAAARQAQGLMSSHRHADYVLFRGGEFPARECMRLLRSTGYDGWFCLEWEKAWHPELEEPEIALPLFPAKLRELDITSV